MVTVRDARAEDSDAIRELHVAAFPTAAEADLVERLRSAGDALISLVAIDELRVIGHVLFSRMDVEADDQTLAGMALAPVAVASDYRAMGIGAALIHAGLRVAESRGADIVFVLGDPAYYRRFGFDTKAAAPFASPYAGPHFQALVLEPGLKPPSSGRADHAPAFAVLAS